MAQHLDDMDFDDRPNHFNHPISQGSRPKIDFFN